MQILNTRCCAVKEMVSIRTEASPVGVLENVCRHVWPKKDATLNTYRLNNYNRYSKPSAHYIFTGVVKYGTKMMSSMPVKYGPDLAAYILKNKLGAVVESVPEFNRVNNPSHLIQVWVWTPDPTRLRRWWTKNNPEKPKK